MALKAAKQHILMPDDNDFYRLHYHQVLLLLIGMFVLLLLAVFLVAYQINYRPLPIFYAKQPNGQQMELKPFVEPNFLPDTLSRWASKAVTTAYTFDFANYEKQIELAKPYFTSLGWQDYLRSVDVLIKTIVQNQLLVTGVVSGPPFISNQGPLPGKGQVWRIQVPFLVTYQSANTTSKLNFIVVVTIVKVPPATNPQGIGIDQFVMVPV